MSCCLFKDDHFIMRDYDITIKGSEKNFLRRNIYFKQGITVSGLFQDEI